MNMGFPGGSEVKNPLASTGDMGSISGSGRSPGGENGNPLWYSCLRNLMDRGWWAAVHGTAESDMTERLSNNNKVNITASSVLSLWWRKSYPPIFCEHYFPSKLSSRRQILRLSTAYAFTVSHCDQKPGCWLQSDYTSVSRWALD